MNTESDKLKELGAIQHQGIGVLVDEASDHILIAFFNEAEELEDFVTLNFKMADEFGNALFEAFNRIAKKKLASQNKGSGLIKPENKIIVI